MIRNNLKVSLRVLLRSKGYGIINIAGLAMGMGVALLIGLWMYDELSYNTCHDHYDRIAQVYHHKTVNGEVNTVPGSPIPVGNELKTTYKNDFKRVVTAWWQDDHILSNNEAKAMHSGTFMEPAALEMFSFRMVKGSRASLNDPSSIILSEATARAFFGDADPIGKSLRIDNFLDVTVTGVFESFPQNARFHTLEFVSPWDLWVNANWWLKEESHSWTSDVNVFVELEPHATFASTSAKIKDLLFKNLPPHQGKLDNPRLFLEPMSRWHLHGRYKNGQPFGGRIQFVWMFGIIGAFVLLLACINFMNLSTAQSEKRAREVGIRKSIGSMRSQLVYQFLSESLLVVLVAFILAMAIVSVCLPWFNVLAGKRTEMPWSSVNFWIASAAFIVLTALLAGSYPAIFLSSFQPVTVLKGTFKAGRLSSLPRKILVTTQFAVSVALITGTVAVWKQIQHAKSRPIGYTREGLIMIRKNSPELWGKFQPLKNELQAADAITDMAESSTPATAIWFTSSDVSWKGKDPGQQTNFVTMGVTHDYGKTVGWNFLQGRDYSREHATDSSAVILNEAAVELMGLTDPVNEEITWKGKKYTVIGVIENMIVDSPFEPVKQEIFWLDYNQTIWMTLRLNPALTTSDAIGRVEKVFGKVIPSVPLEYTFIDQAYAAKFSAEERLGKLASVFATLAIFISCLGLLGLASFVAEQRKKEIGIRKILGASVGNLWTMLSREFVLLVGISCLFGIPVSWYFLQQWLQQYEYRTVLSLWIFAIPALGALLITVAIVSIQTWKASATNPVTALRTE